MEQNYETNISNFIRDVHLLLNIIEYPQYSEYSEYSEYYYNNDYNNINIPDDFWDPVLVALGEHDTLRILNSEISGTSQCTICTENNELIQIECCNNEICKECIANWFAVSVFCPYCKMDLRK